MFGEDFKYMGGPYSQKAKDLLIYFKGTVPLDKREHYDFTPYRFKKRMEVATNEIIKVKDRLKGVCDEYLIEAFFAFTNSLMYRGGYNDTIDSYSFTSMSAAIWILDQLSLQGKLEECYPYLPTVPVKNGLPPFSCPFISHPLYDYELILSMIQLIRQRNTSKPFDDKLAGALQWDAKKPDKDDASRKNRADFDAVMRLLDKKAVEQAVKKYEDDVWRIYRLSFQAYALLEKHYLNLKKERAKIESSSESVVSNQSQPKPLVLLAKPDVNDLLDEPVAPDLRDLRIESLRREINELESITFTDLALANDREKAVRKLGNIIPKDLAEDLIHFHVDDPFESAFALLYLLDKDSNIPWFYFGSISVAYTMYDQFPYDAPPQMDGEPVLLSGLNSVLYEHKYSGYRWDDITDASNEPVQRDYAKNLSQLIFANSWAVFPRVIPKVDSIDAFLDGLGELTEREREVYTLLLYSLHAGNIRENIESLDAYRLTKELEEDVPEVTEIDEPEQPQDDREALQEEIERLRDKNDRLLAVLRENLEQKKYRTDQLEFLSETVRRQKTELADLREKVFLLDQHDVVEEPEDKTISYPYHTRGRILSFGGHASWISEMKKKLPDIVFISPDVLPNTDLIRGADEVWIQTNCISHKDYYRIMETIRSMDKQVRYFVYAGVNKCAEQVVKACEQGK